MAQAKKRGLGRGLESLLGIEAKVEEVAEAAGELRVVGVTSVAPGRYQPRRHIEPAALEELASSIKAQGLIQPIVVRDAGGGRYELIAGERRWRATQLAGLPDIKALVIDVPEQSAMAMALIENIQRQDLNPLEEAHALKRLVDEFTLTHQQVADAVGRSRAAVTNLLRLIDLPEAIRTLLEQRKLEMGHARALLTLPEVEAQRLARAAVEAGWSVRELEEQVRTAHGQSGPGKAKGKGKSPKARRRVDADVTRLEQEIGETLGAPVRIESKANGRGRLVIEYFSLDELDGILDRLRS
jgi:ParB family chromosome partitioning protein